MLKNVSSSLLLLCFVFGLFFVSMPISSSAAEIDVLNKEQKVELAKNYIENNVTNLNEILMNMQTQDPDLEDVQTVIMEYLDENSVPEEIVNDLTIDDIFPLENEKVEYKQKENEVLQFEDIVAYAKDNDEGNIYEFKNEDGKVTVYVADTGEVMIHEQSIVPTLDLNDNNTLAAWKTTKTERSNGVAVNAVGKTMFTYWASGNFEYNGKSARHLNNDGNIERKLWGSSLVIEKKAEGAKRTVAVGSYKYPEVYSRVYFEATFGIRWLGVTMKSGTFEAYVGGTYAGSVYGGLRAI
ncbi:hypothetical protein J8TS2_05930 [Lederbergia ruris]|uniref:Uncharacterized protein n=1 Tax=Lederbergia ruris TaxID=217495 RepID=A0ABQ4KGM4_9BACI|nr:hypothetical protein [Lederbergia ruris]GIN56274.1 hypothetical protein J8TS2_05930 [Lederbergia ruris]